MPVVPFSSANASRQVEGAPLRTPPTEPWALMAAAQMHDEGRLLPPTKSNPLGPVANERTRQVPNNR